MFLKSPILFQRLSSAPPSKLNPVTQGHDNLRFEFQLVLLALSSCGNIREGCCQLSVILLLIPGWPGVWPAGEVWGATEYQIPLLCIILLAKLS